MEALFLLWISWFGYVGASHFFVTVPNVLRFNHEETALVSVFSESNFRVETWLDIEGRSFSRNVVWVRDEENPTTTTIQVTEKDLFKDGDKEEKRQKKPTFVTLYARTSRGTFSNKIPLSYDTGYILVQTSKPLYHPQERVQVRALAMTEAMKYAHGWNISMDFISPSGLTFGRFAREGHDKFFAESFLLPPNVEPGVWTVKAYYTGQYSTQGTAHFQVKEYVLPTFGVTIIVSESVILPSTKEATITVKAKYVYNKPVKGKVILTISCLDDDGNITSLREQPHITLDGEGIAKHIIVVDDLTNVVGRFPDGQHLHVSARAIELATLNEEIGTNAKSLFSSKLYIFNFDKAKKIYHPALSYYLRVTVSLANGDHPGELNVKAVWNNKEEIEMSDAKGVTQFVFIPSADMKDQITFKVSVGNEGVDYFSVRPYKGNDQLQVDHIIRNGKLMLSAYTNIKGDQYTSIMCLILSRGKYMHYQQLEAAINPEADISEAVQKKVSPEARIVGFYVNKRDGSIIADSTQFSLEPKCRGRGLTLKPSMTNVSPGSSHTLGIDGVPHMTVGLNIMDEALLLLDNENVLRKSKMFDMMKSHDLGCGQGGGITAEQVFRDAGLTVVTNAKVDKATIERSAYPCEGQSRKKRSLDCSATSKANCCKEGERVAQDIIDNYGDVDELQLHAETACQGKTWIIATEKDKGGHKYSFSCVKHFYYKCVDTIRGYIQDNQLVENSALDTSSEYMDALKKYNLNIDDIFVRSDFKDSWLFTSVELNEKGILGIEKDLHFPSSITDWMIQGIGISEDMGLCIADPVNVTAFKNFFIKLELPYKATRLEYFEITATLFNYGRDEIQGDVFIEGIKGLCINADPGKTEKLSEFVLPPNDAKTVRIPMLPLEARKFPIKITALGNYKGNPVSDAVEKKLLVVNEGIEMREAITVCLDPRDIEEGDRNCTSSKRVISSRIDIDKQIATVELTMPAKAIKDTGSAYAYVSSNVMDDTVMTMISGMDNLLDKPHGCGEQTMIYLAPGVYVVTYWQQTKQMNPHREQRANDWIRYGVTRELTFRKGDGSFAASLSRISSTWLTAFVGKVFCQAHRVIDNAVRPAQDIVPTIKWLQTKMNHMGKFYDEKPVSHREMIGQVREDDPSLTAFVLITLTECGDRTWNIDTTISRAVAYLEHLSDHKYRNDKFLLAISTYALAMADSGKKWHYLEMLLENDNAARLRGPEAKARQRAKGRYWGFPGGYPAYKDAVETTSYALLAMLKFDLIKEAGNVVKWLVLQRDAMGFFRSTQDTIVGLQALSAYTVATFSREVKLNIKLSMDGWDGRSLQLNKDNEDLLELVKYIPLSRDKTIMTVGTKGIGTGRLVIDYRYNRKPTEHEKCSFNISDIERKLLDPLDIEIGIDFNRKCDACQCIDDFGGNDNNIKFEVEKGDEVKVHIDKREAGDEEKAIGVNLAATYCIKFNIRSVDNMRHGMSIIDVGLETGMTVEERDLKKMKENGVIDMYEMPGQDKAFFILYLDDITSDPKEIIFRVKDYFKGDKASRQTAAIKIYDYYHPEYECTLFYGTGVISGSTVDYQCENEEGNREETCSCLQTVCPYPNEADVLRKMAKAKKRPADALVDLTCDSTRANFAAIVKVTSKDDHAEAGTRSAHVTVVRSIHKGKMDLTKGDKMELELRLFCNITLTEDQEYYLISKDGIGQKPTKCHLTETTIMVDFADTSLMNSHEKKAFFNTQEGFLQRIMNVYENRIRGGCKH